MGPKPARHSLEPTDQLDERCECCDEQQMRPDRQAYQCKTGLDCNRQRCVSAIRNHVPETSGDPTGGAGSGVRCRCCVLVTSGFNGPRWAAVGDTAPGGRARASCSGLGGIRRQLRHRQRPSRIRGHGGANDMTAPDDGGHVTTKSAQVQERTISPVHRDQRGPVVAREEPRCS